MATVQVQQEPKYSAKLKDMIQELKTAYLHIDKSVKRRNEVIVRVFEHVDKSKEISSDQAVEMIKDICHISKATIYRCLPQELKRKYERKSQVRQFLPEQVRYDIVKLVLIKGDKETPFQFEKILVENYMGRLKIFHHNQDVHLEES